MSIYIKKLTHDEEIKEYVQILRRSFQTVAEDFQITESNAPSNPAFITMDHMKEAVAKGTEFFGLYQTKELIGCVAVELSEKMPQLYYIERLAILPQYRHKGLGKQLMDFAFQSIKAKGGETVSIGIINENTRLKQWYEHYGFKEIEVRSFSHLPFMVCFMEKAV